LYDAAHTTKTANFFISVALAVIAVVVRFHKGMQMPLFPTGGFLILLIGYLVLLAGDLFEGT